MDSYTDHSNPLRHYYFAKSNYNINDYQPGESKRKAIEENHIPSLRYHKLVPVMPSKKYSVEMYLNSCNVMYEILLIVQRIFIITCYYCFESSVKTRK